MLMAQKQNEKLNRRFDSINVWNRLVYMKHIMFLQQLGEMERYVPVVDDVEGIRQFIKYNKDDMQGMFRFDVIPGSSGPKTTEMKKQSELTLFQTVAPILQQQGESIWPAFQRLAQAFDWQDTDLLKKGVKDEAKMLAALLFKFQQGQAKPQDLLGQATKLVFAELSQPEIQQVKALLEQQTGGGAPGQGMAPAPKGMPGDPNQNRPMPEGM